VVQNRTLQQDSAGIGRYLDQSVGEVKTRHSLQDEYSGIGRIEVNKPVGRTIEQDSAASYGKSISNSSPNGESDPSNI